MATMRFYNVTAVPTISSAEGTYYVKDANGYVQEYLVTGGLVKYIGGYPMQNKGTDVEKPMSQKAVTDELALKADAAALADEVNRAKAAEQANATEITNTKEAIPTIADDLTTDDAAKALSAKQGKVLHEMAVIQGQSLIDIGDFLLNYGQSKLLANKYNFVHGMWVGPSTFNTQGNYGKCISSSKFPL